MGRKLSISTKISISNTPLATAVKTKKFWGGGELIIVGLKCQDSVMKIEIN